MKGFKKKCFGPHEKKQIEFKIDVEMLKFWNGDLKYVAEEGEFKVYVGGDSVNVLEEKFEFCS